MSEKVFLIVCVVFSCEYQILKEPGVPAGLFAFFREK